MSHPRKPWWLLVNQPKGLITTIQDRSTPGERVFVVRGEPVVQGLTWLTCGPLGALATIGALTGLAMAFSVQEQPWSLRILFIASFLVLPALVWGVTVAVAGRLARKPLREIREAETRQRIIRLNQNEEQLTYQIDSTGETIEIPYQTIRHIHVTPALGARDANAIYLTLETDTGPVVILDDTLGTHAQKADLVREMEATLHSASAKKNPSDLGRNL